MLPRRVEAVVFDMDGLLVDTEALIRDALLHVSAEFGKPMSLTQFLQLVGHTREASDALLIQHFGDGFDLSPFRVRVEAHVRSISQAGAALKTGVVELLDLLEAHGVPRAIATSSSHRAVQRHFTTHGFAPRFQAVIARGDYAHGKPNPEPYLTAARALGVDPAFCLALEDSHNGIRAAHGAGMMTVMVPDLLEANEEMREKALHIVETLHDVRKMLVKQFGS